MLKLNKMKPVNVTNKKMFVKMNFGILICFNFAPI